MDKQLTASWEDFLECYTPPLNKPDYTTTDNKCSIAVDLTFETMARLELLAKNTGRTVEQVIEDELETQALLQLGDTDE